MRYLIIFLTLICYPAMSEVKSKTYRCFDTKSNSGYWFGENGYLYVADYGLKEIMDGGDMTKKRLISMDFNGFTVIANQSTGNTLVGVRENDYKISVYKFNRSTLKGSIRITHPTGIERNVYINFSCTR